MKIRDSFATLNNDKTEHELPSGGLEIIADDGRALFQIRLNKDGTLDVRPGHDCWHGGKRYDDTFYMRFIASNAVEFQRDEYKP